MAIVRSGKRSRVSNPNLNFSPESVDAISSDNGSDYDSGMESDGGCSVDTAEVGAEAVQLGDRSFSVLIELYDLKDLSLVLSVCNWNELLSEEERFYLSKYLPDMDPETLVKTLIELLGGKNFHFGSPAVDFFGKLKGGEFEPGVSVYRQGLSCFRKSEHYYQIREYHNSMVSGLFQIKGAWEKCKGYGVEERLRLLNIMRSRSNFWDENGGDLEQEVDLGDEHFLMKRIKFGHETPGGRCVARAEGFRRSRYQKIGIVGCDIGWKDYEFSAHRDRDGSCRSTVTRSGLSKAEKKQQFSRRYDEFGAEDYAGFPDLTGRRKNLNVVTIASYASESHDNLKMNKYSAKDWKYATNIQSQYHMLTGAKVDWSEGNRRTPYPVEFDRADVSNKEWKVRADFGRYKSKNGSASAARPYKSSPASNGSVHHYSDHVSNVLKEKNARSKFGQTENMDMEYSRGSIIFDQSEETESDLSDQDEEDAGTNPWVKQAKYPNGAMSCHQSRTDRSVFDPAKVNKLATNGENPCIIAPESRSNTHASEAESYLRYGKQKAYSREKRQESAINPVQSLLRRNYRDGYSDVQAEEAQDALNVTYNLQNVHLRANGSRNQARSIDDPDVKTNCNKESYLSACNTVARKRMGKLEDYHEEPYESVYKKSNTHRKMDGPAVKKKRKIDAAIRLSTDITPDPDFSRRGTSDNEQETRPQKKPFTLITPTIHTGFSFSIIHLLSAIRKAMITADLDDMTDGGRHIRKDDAMRESLNNMFENGTSSPLPHKNEDASTSEHSRQNCFPSFTVQDIANRVRSNPGDPCIVETQEPLQDLIRGVLKIFSSKTAPLGAKGWRPLVSYEKSNKGWSWVGPVSSSLSGNDIVDEETSPDAWGIPYKMLVNLVNAFANWLKSSQKTLKQIGSLPAPPISMLANLDEEERFRDLKTQKNPHTINPTSDEQRAYFRKEEYLRYSIPDRAFSYTAADGKKSSVAPLRRGAGKPTSKARDHYILKPGRPPHVTILCLVRDAAARLPGSIGTRADVCTLIRDSQYIVEDVTDMQVNQVVSGALDRLHYEIDPCIHFDNERKLWVYLHRNREEEDFEDDGTSSTKNWKKPRKDSMEPSDLDAANDVSYHGNGDPPEIDPSAGFDLNSDANDYS